MSWASNHDGSLTALQQVQDSLKVGLIMTPREALVSCTRADTAAQIKARNPDRFSFLPIIEGSKGIVGLYDAERWFDVDAPDKSIGHDVIPISEDIMIGADASILDFVRYGDQNPTKLVLKGKMVGGLVSLSDIQKLPARAALFTMITSLEMTLTIVIERHCPEPDYWKGLLSKGRRAKVLEEIEKARVKNGLVSELSFSQFIDKADIIRRLRILDGSLKSLKAEFQCIKRLRDKVAHGNSYADNLDAAISVCSVVRLIYDFNHQLEKVMH
jgi:hypothetical protein